jgi:dihydroflavonol-4-reductase
LVDDESLRIAMRGCDDVFYCVVDARAWLRDPAPLFATNVEGLRHAVDAAVAAKLRRFVFTSTIGTVGLSDDGPATEDTPFNWSDRGGAYIRSRVQAENLVLRYVEENELPAVVLCIANTYGPRDWQPTPHGALVAAAATGGMPFYIKDIGTEVVGIEDAAQALTLAADKGRIGERYIISERFLTARELYNTAADAGGSRRPRIGLPLRAAYALAFGGNIAATMSRRDVRLSTLMVRLMHIMSPMNHGKATRELGWEPEPIHQAIHKAVAFYRDQAK